ncbi:hypothetical protein F0562_002022 [Nyssa sinensis]|uniref:dolichol kinase n=1 Tax=Nyssa sinensis TaxID=561372 RepID=A0A5J5C4V5_9ASTE|nr:hypothetical protein F0562_002022 [Nyssa sinensis]
MASQVKWRPWLHRCSTAREPWLFSSSLASSCPLLSLSLLSEGLALSLLALFAFFVEIIAEASNSLGQFKTRPGASSGILLGTVTLPGLVISRLVQLSRAMSLHEVEVEVEVEELEYLRSVLCVTCYNISKWLAHSIEVIVGTLSWISSCEVSSARASYFSIMCFHWVINFVFLEPLKRLSLCIYWVALVYVSVIRFYNISKNSKIERILLRKYYHLLADSMFLPALIFQPRFLDLAFGAALAVFLVLEIVRIWKIWPLGHLVHQFMNAFMDHRDSDLLIVSHFSLLLGCALPIWMSSGFNDRPLAPFAGSHFPGDSMASMVRCKYGVLRWSKTGKKTIEGTAAGITSVLAACSVLLPLLATTGYFYTQHWFSLLIAVTGSGLLEAYTAQLDNAFIPLVFYSLLCL